MPRLTRAEQQARTRQAVIEAAVEELLEHGYGAAKIDRIAERASLTRGAVYSNFQGKRSLAVAAMAELSARWDIRRTDAPDGTVGGTLARILDGRGEVVGTEVAAQTGAFSWSDMLQLMAEDPPLTAVLQGVLDLQAVLLADTLSRVAAAAGEPARADHLDVAQAFVVLAQGWQVQWTLPRPAPIEVIISAARSLASMPPVAAPSTRGDRGEAAAPLPDGWAPSQAVHDLVRDSALDPERLTGAVAVEGLHALPDVAYLAALCTTGGEGAVLLVVGTGDMEEIEPFARMSIGVWCRLIRQAAPESCWPAMAVVIDTDGAITASLPDPRRATA